MTKPSKQQIAAVKSALREIHAELLGWDPHILVLFKNDAQKAQIIARMKQLGWHPIDDPSNETADVSMVEFSLDAISSKTATIPARLGSGKTRRVKFPAAMFASFAVMSALVGMILAAAAIYWDHRMENLDKAGTMATGRIERTYSESSRNGRTYYVSYRFADVRGTSHESDDAYPFDDWSILRQGDPISVTYLAGDPERNNLTKRVKLIVNRNPKNEMMLVGIPWVISGCFFLGYLVRKRLS